MASDSGACSINIGAAGVSQRRKQGIAFLVIAIAAAAAAVAFGVPWPWRAAVAIPFFVAGLGIFQARAKT